MKRRPEPAATSAAPVAVAPARRRDQPHLAGTVPPAGLDGGIWASLLRSFAALISQDHSHPDGVRVLIVDDDAPIRRMLARTLVAEGHQVRVVADGGAALAEVERSVPDVIILDVSMPGLDGLAVCRRLRGRGLAVPILLLTARDAVDDRVRGLDAGGDDYLVKPFAPEELSARIRALIRRGHAPIHLLAFGDLTLDTTRRCARRRGREVQLTPRESALLELLLRAPRRVVTRADALRVVWGDESAATQNVVDRYIAYLRRKLEPPVLITTIRGVGFVLADT